MTAGSGAVEAASALVAQHQRLLDPKSGPCLCGEWPPEGRGVPWNDHVAEALHAAGLLASPVGADAPESTLAAVMASADCGEPDNAPCSCYTAVDDLSFADLKAALATSDLTLEKPMHTCDQSPCGHAEDTPAPADSVTPASAAERIVEWEVVYRQKRGRTPHWDERVARLRCRADAVALVEAIEKAEETADATVWCRTVTPWQRADLRATDVCS